ncbi:hypothetical protein GCM10010211_30740 [Streptomyces albospinus]|uniref:DUF2637 domain-containing protein n=1 Tax=Streptomyces albospinus TaxID=285515 RepID=A0ABQ2V0W3_9ACTN|nr:DUF2637 domain-containing protein [Streptomyces albospinus]GGU63558.1 hypothetical protein GCM10010211_30740 [Streptomyces albospinus]
MNRVLWRIALAVVSLAALGVTGWSLYAVARHYQAPGPVGWAAVAVFDGTAYACLHLASEASAAGRSAAGARLASLFMAAGSVYLNRFHAQLIDGGLPACLLFSVPTLALLAVSELSWAGPRAEARRGHGEQPFRLPQFGGWAWLLAPRTAGGSIRRRALAHIEDAGQPPAPSPDKPRTATDQLREHFATMEAAEAIRIAHASQPMLPPAELAALLVGYGVHVDAVQVALALHGTPTEITVDRPDSVRTTPDPAQEAEANTELTRADMLSGRRPESVTEAVRQLVRRGITDKGAVVSITRDLLGPDTNPDTVRRTLQREIDKHAEAIDGVGQGGGGYA